MRKNTWKKKLRQRRDSGGMERVCEVGERSQVSGEGSGESCDVPDESGVGSGALCEVGEWSEVSGEGSGESCNVPDEIGVGSGALCEVGEGSQVGGEGSGESYDEPDGEINEYDEPNGASCELESGVVVDDNEEGEGEELGHDLKGKRKSYARETKLQFYITSTRQQRNLA